MTKLQLRGLFLNANQLTHMPMDFRMPSCINPDGTVSRDCCDLRWNQWRCPIPAWMTKGHPAGGSDHECNGAANCTACKKLIADRAVGKVTALLDGGDEDETPQ